MVTLMVDMLRAGVTTYPTLEDDGDDEGETPYVRVPNPQPQPAAPILMYVLAHFPGNTATSWRRQFLGDLAHGVKFIDLFLFQTSFSGFTCDYVRHGCVLDLRVHACC